MYKKVSRVFYGWWIVGALFVIQAYTAGVIFFGLTAFIEPIINEFGWSYALVSFAASIRSVEMGAFAPAIGLLIDRWGPKKLIITGLFFLSLGLFLWSYTSSLAQFYGFFILVAVGISTCMGVLPMTVVGYWFRKRVSLATGIVMTGVGVGGFLVPFVTQIIGIYGWRTAAVIFAAGSWIIIFPLSLIIRHKPEQYGYLIDGDENIKPVFNEGQVTLQQNEIDIGIMQAVKTAAFWQISVGIMCFTTVMYAVITHVMPYLSTIGVSRSDAALLASAIPLASIIGRLGFGWFGDKYDRKKVLILGIILVGVSLIPFIFIATSRIEPIIISLVVFGIGYGGIIVMHPAIIREYFGRENLGAILGFSAGITIIGSILGPPLAGWIFDSSGSYRFAWILFTGLSAIALIIIFTTSSASAMQQKIKSVL